MIGANGTDAALVTKPRSPLFDDDALISESLAFVLADTTRFNARRAGFGRGAVARNSPSQR